jgi:hypothetical protein
MPLLSSSGFSLGLEKRPVRPQVLQYGTTGLPHRSSMSASAIERQLEFRCLNYHNLPLCCRSYKPQAIRKTAKAAIPNATPFFLVLTNPYEDVKLPSGTVERDSSRGM